MDDAEDVGGTELLRIKRTKPVSAARLTMAW
jgi:hypothetical protein